MKLKRFTDEGLRLFEKFWQELKDDPFADIPMHLLGGEGFAEEVTGAPALTETEFGTRLELGKWLLRSVPTDRALDRNLWAWLTLFLFDQLCPKNENGKRMVKAKHRLVPQLDSYRTYYRHLLVGPYLVCLAHKDDPDSTLFLLCNPPYKPGEVFEQIASGQERLPSKGVIETARRLYFDIQQGGNKVGAAGSGPGSARKLVKYFKQLNLTFDLHSLEAETLLGMLPQQFDRFKG